MSKSKLCAAPVIVALATATVSVSAAPPSGAEAPGDVVENTPVETEAIPALAIAGGLGLAGAFVLGFLQGYTDAKNEQLKAAQESSRADIGTITALMHFDVGSIDYVLD